MLRLVLEFQQVPMVLVDLVLQLPPSVLGYLGFLVHLEVQLVLLVLLGQQVLAVLETQVVRLYLGCQLHLSDPVVPQGLLVLVAHQVLWGQEAHFLL